MTYPPRGLAVRVYEVLERAVEEGVASGCVRAYKHTSEQQPPTEAQREEIVRAIIASVLEWFEVELGD